MAGDRQAASRAFEEALELNPDTVSALTALGIMAVEESRVERGVELWRRAVELDARQLPRLLAVATQLWNRGDVSVARPLLALFASTAPADQYRFEIARIRELLAESG